MAVGVESAGESYGLLVDSVGEVLKLDDTAREANPVNLDPRLAQVSAGIYPARDSNCWWCSMSTACFDRRTRPSRRECGLGEDTVAARSATERVRNTMKTCLVVDDSSVIRKVARRILEGIEFQIVEAEDGEQALEACRKQLPEAILLDWNMPKMDGYEFLRSLRRLPGGERRKWCSARRRTTWRTSRARSMPAPTNTS